MTDVKVLELRVAVTADDFTAMSKFYREGLGLEPSQVWPEDQGRSLVLDFSQATLEIFDEKQAETVDKLETGRRTSGRYRFAIKVSDLRSATDRLIAHGATLVQPTVTTPWGDQVVRFQDPDGMQVTLFQSAVS
ncbi:MAG: hypothetical protein A2Y54_10505 [Chloroflexi bacterium RBG_16_51_16]|nr:MAG: hypothetical protein A2Y54_10505 [Chloroflexi bacterium RBG_16_51_16]